MLELAFQADRGSGEPLYRQLELYLRGLIETGRLAPGVQLPASRMLAESLGLARNTVNQAYQGLTQDGLLRSHVGQGTFVAGRLREVAPPDEAAPRPYAWEGLAAKRQRRLQFPAGLAPMPKPRIDLAPGQVDRGTLPASELKRAYGRVLSRLESLGDAVDPRGWLPLRRAVARSLVSRGLSCDTQEVMIVSGAQQALDLVARTLVDPGDTVAIEQPGYFGAVAAFSAAEANLVGVGVDDRGLCTDALARIVAEQRVKLVYTTPAVQSPTGVALSEARRRALLALADAEQLPIVEDDYDSELRHGTPPVPALKQLDRAGQVIYLGTFSKALFAGLRIGYVVAPVPLLARMATMRWASDFHSDIVTQAALVDLLESGALERHVRRVRHLYTERREALEAALALHMPEDTRVTSPAGGNAFWLRLPDATDMDAFHAAAAETGIAYGRGEAFALPDGPAAAEARRHLQLGFARIEASRIDDAVRKLAQLVASARSQRSA